MNRRDFIKLGAVSAAVAATVGFRPAEEPPWNGGIFTKSELIAMGYKPVHTPCFLVDSRSETEWVKPSPPVAAYDVYPMATRVYRAKTVYLAVLPMGTVKEGVAKELALKVRKGTFVYSVGFGPDIVCPDGTFKTVYIRCAKAKSTPADSRPQIQSGHFSFT